jgi:hypothetical protein
LELAFVWLLEVMMIWTQALRIGKEALLSEIAERMSIRKNERT